MLQAAPAWLRRFVDVDPADLRNEFAAKKVANATELVNIKSTTTSN
jgi:hypothetical protein